MRVIRLLTAALAALAAGPAAATQEYILPTLFDVAGVPDTDALNIRSGPGVQHEIVGRLGHDAQGVEVVAHSPDGEWGQVFHGEGAGWVAMRFLAYRTDVWEPGALPAGLQCLGTEPFWSLAPAEGALVLERPEAPAVEAPIAAILDSGVFRDPRRAVVAGGDGGRLTLTMEARACSDGMSDRVYGLSAMLVHEGDGEPALLTGCCRLAP
jgi:uncharacterized membrane protein